MRPNWSLILERTKCRVKKRGEEKKKRRIREEEEEEEEKKGMETMILYGILWFCMDWYGFIWDLYGY